MSDRNCPDLAEICHDGAERLALSVSRFIAAGYMTSDAACWDAAHACAEEVLGPVAGPRLVAAMASVMRALRVERFEPWSFMPAPCCRATGNEADLVAALQCARRGTPDALCEAACRLTGAQDAPRLAAVLKSAADILDSLAPLVGKAKPSRRSMRVH
jgi:hypothetical protein